MDTSLDKSIVDIDEMVLNMGPQHPSTHGVLRLKIHTDGEVVSNIEPILGYLHRCFEKHCDSSAGYFDNDCNSVFHCPIFS